MGAGIHPYVRNDNSDAVYQVDSVNTVPTEKRINGLLYGNREELGQNNWLVFVYIDGDINTPDGMAERLSSANLRNF